MITQHRIISWGFSIAFRELETRRVHYKAAERELFFSLFYSLGENGEVHASAARKDERGSEKRARRRTLIKKRNAISCIFVLLQAAAAR
jgi:hypothetical protein